MWNVIKKSLFFISLENLKKNDTVFSVKIYLNLKNSKFIKKADIKLVSSVSNFPTPKKI